MTEPLPIGVAISGSGSTLQNLLDRIAAGSLPVQVVAVVSSRADAAGLVRASKAGVPHATFEVRSYPDHESYGSAVFSYFREHGAKWIALAGFLKHLWVPPDFEGKVLNIHPALLPAHGGKGMYGDNVHRAVLESGERETGCTVHLVDQEYDRGPILLQKRVPVLPGDTLEALRERVMAAEREAYPEVLASIARDPDRPLVPPPSS
jgi:phosphoribosylglycinamide formyltransferase-1